MLKRIDPSDAQIGMFIHKLEGSWWNHPFWKAKFLLNDPQQLSRLRHSALDAVVIDTSKGRDVLSARMPLENESDEEREDRTKRRRAPWARHDDSAQTNARAAQPVGPRSMAREFGKASQLAERGQKLVSRVFFEIRLGRVVKVDDVEPVIEDVFASVQRNPNAFNGLMRCKRDTEYVYRHALATSALMISLGRQMKLAPDMIHAAGLAGLLVDSGISLLPLDLAEYDGDPRRIPDALMREHVQYGHDFALSSRFDADVATAVLEHHERIDGTGYPHGRSGDEISLLGRMAAICDSYDELANDVDGSGGMDPSATLSHMLADHGAYDPDIMQAFIATVGVYPIGSFVLLRSGRVAMVVDQNADEAKLPKVRVFYSLKLGQAVAQSTIDLAHCYGEDAIERLAEAEELPATDVGKLRMKLLSGACGA